MIVDISAQDIQELNHSSMKSFYHTQSDRFEHYKGNIEDIGEDGKGTLLWYGEENKLDALIAYQYYSQEHKCVLLWDMAENPTPQWCLYVNTIWTHKVFKKGYVFKHKDIKNEHN